MKKTRLVLCKRICCISLSLALIFSLNMTVLAGDMVEMGIDAEADAELQTQTTAVVASDFDINWKYEVNESEQTVLFTRYIGEDTDVVVPAKINIEGKEYSVIVDAYGASIFDDIRIGAFDKNERITTVRFMEGCKIESDCMRWTFAGCTNLISVSAIPQDVTDMWGTFENCINLTTAPEIPQSVTNMSGTFDNCVSLTTAPEIPQSVTDMSNTFNWCQSLTTAPEIPQSVTDMSNTFSCCSSLTTAPEIPQGITNMSGTFMGCSSLLTAPEIPQSVTDMHETFMGCSSLTTAPEILQGVTDMSDTFRGCNSLTTAPKILQSVINMSGTFIDCSSLTTAPEIPLSVTSMESTFSGCNSLTTAPKIPQSVTNMESTFSNCSSLTTAPEIPKGVTNMEDTFWECSSLTTAPQIPQGVTNMSGTFYHCDSLTTAPEIPQGVTSMWGTFMHCRRLTTAPEIPQSVTDMSNTFFCCSNLVTVSEIPQGVTNMSGTFVGCSSLMTAPEIPQSVTDMSETFSGCSSLSTAPEIPQSVTDMHKTFWDCSSLVTVSEIPQGVTNLSGTFGRCSSLTGQLTIEMDTHNVSSDSFEDCFYDAATSDEGLSVNYSGNCTRIDEIIATKGDESNITKGKNIDLADIEKYKVNFDCGGGTASPLNVTVTYGSTYGTLPTPTRQHYKFLGWYTSESGGIQITSASKVEIGKEHTLYARWSGEAYNVAYDAAGGNLNEKSKTIIYGEAYRVLPTPTRQYYEFLGWYTSKSGGSRVTADTRVLTGGNHTLYARWIGTAYKVSYNANGGKSSVKSKLVNYGSAYGQLPAPVRTGYKFKGWFISKKGGKKVTSATSFTTVKDITLYAGWDKISVKKVASIQLKNKKSKQMTGTIKRVRGVKGYQIVYGLNKSVTKGKKSFLSTSTKFTTNKLKKGRTYYVKARGYVVDSAGKKVYGSYSAVKSLKIKK